MKLLIYHRRADELTELIGTRVPDLEIAAGFDDATLSRHLPDAEILLCFQLPAAALARAERLRWIQLTSAGAEQLLPGRAWLSRVTVTNTRGIHVDLMADYALGMIAVLQWDVARALRDQQARTWEQRLILPLAGQTLLVVGAGAIGSEIVRRGAACGLRVIAVKRTPGAVEGAAEVVTADRLAEALPRADYVVLVVPVTAQTRRMIGEVQLRAMKRTARLINIARGSVVDEDALVRALAEGWIAGAALDVFDEEPLPPTSRLWTLPNVIITPHIAGEPADYPHRVADVFVANAARFARGDTFENVVDLARGY